MARIGWRAGAARLLLAAALGAAGVSTATAQGDPLERAKALRRVADQQAEANVRELLRETDKAARVSPSAAIRRLRDTIRGLDLSVEITSEKRQELVTRLQAKIDALEGKTAPVVDAKLQQKKAAQRKAFEAYLAEAKDVRAAVAEIERLYEAGRVREAQAKEAALGRKYPNNPAVLTLLNQGAIAERVAQARRLAKEQNDRVLFAMNSAAQSALPPKGDVEFPKNWHELSKRRLNQELKLGPDEEAILKALETHVKKELRDAPFEETVQQLSNLIDKPIYLDKKSLEEAGLDLRKPVTMPGNVSARTALRAVLQSQGLTFIVKDKVIQVVTLEKAQQSLVTRAYYLGDVISLTGKPFSGAVTWGPIADAQQTAHNAQFIIDAITQSVDPLTWKPKGGPSTVVFHYPSLSLIVRAPAEVHATLGSKHGNSPGR
jgi:hypothetical protein